MRTPIYGRVLSKADTGSDASKAHAGSLWASFLRCGSDLSTWKIHASNGTKVPIFTALKRLTYVGNRCQQGAGDKSLLAQGSGFRACGMYSIKPPRNLSLPLSFSLSLSVFFFFSLSLSFFLSLFFSLSHSLSLSLLLYLFLFLYLSLCLYLSPFLCLSLSFSLSLSLSLSLSPWLFPRSLALLLVESPQFC